MTRCGLGSILSNQCNRVSTLAPAWVAANLYPLGSNLGSQLGEVRGNGALRHWSRYQHSERALSFGIDESRKNVWLQSVQKLLNCNQVSSGQGRGGCHLHRRGTPGKIWMLPLTTATGTHRSSCGKMNCLPMSRPLSVGSSTIRSLAFRAGESVFQSNLGWDGCGLESFFIFSNASACSTRGSSKALAMDS